MRAHSGTFYPKKQEPFVELKHLKSGDDFHFNQSDVMPTFTIQLRYNGDDENTIYPPTKSYLPAFPQSIAATVDL